MAQPVTPEQDTPEVRNNPLSAEDIRRRIRQEVSAAIQDALPPPATATPQPSVLATETPGPSGIGERSGRWIGKRASVMRVDAHVMCAYEVFTAWGTLCGAGPTASELYPSPGYIGHDPASSIRLGHTDSREVTVW